MIHTILTNCSLYRIHRDRQHMLNKAERRRAALLLLAIFVFVALTIIIIISGRPCLECK